MVETAVTIRVQVCYAAPDRQFLQTLDTPLGATIRFAIDASGVADIHAEIDPDACKTGVFGKLRPHDTVLRNGDRVEIYRPLVADPMDSRRRRALKNASAKSI